MENKCDSKTALKTLSINAPFVCGFCAFELQQIAANTQAARLLNVPLCPRLRPGTRRRLGNFATAIALL